VAVGGENSALLSHVMEELVRFRSKVRLYALALPAQGAEGAQGPQEEQKEKRKEMMQERKPLLEACDSLRRDLAAFGVHIQ
ncbi:SYCM protein, partial [Alcedo cyanopectus]|nr:SYCM protein [Ceyx cyanopectus]NXY91848.1 SYCM protein [Ceyx cyanopectus]